MCVCVCLCERAPQYVGLTAHRVPRIFFAPHLNVFFFFLSAEESGGTPMRKPFTGTLRGQNRFFQSGVEHIKMHQRKIYHIIAPPRFFTQRGFQVVGKSVISEGDCCEPWCSPRTPLKYAPMSLQGDSHCLSLYFW